MNFLPWKLYRARWNVIAPNNDIPPIFSDFLGAITFHVVYITQYILFCIWQKSGDAGYRSRYLPHAKRALYHLSYTPTIKLDHILRFQLGFSKVVNKWSGTVRYTESFVEYVSIGLNLQLRYWSSRNDVWHIQYWHIQYWANTVIHSLTC